MKSEHLIPGDTYEAPPDARQLPAPPVKLSSKDWLAVVVMPVVVVLLTAVVGTGVAVWLQNRSFKRNELFRVRLERLMYLHTEGIQILREVDAARRQIRSNEDMVAQDVRDNPSDAIAVVNFHRGQNLMRSSLTSLNDAKLRLDSLLVDSKQLSDNSDVAEAVRAYGVKHEQFVACIEGNEKFDRVCSDLHGDIVVVMQTVVSAHGRMIDRFVEQFK